MSSMKKILQQRYLMLMSLPFIAWLFIFQYLPLWGWVMAFQKYRPGRAFAEQEWVGFANFVQLFADDRFYLVLRNTLAMSLMNLAVGFTVPILFALLLNEIRLMWFKRTIQTIAYLPHFVSWVIVAGLVTKLLSTQGGALNDLLLFMGWIDEPIPFMAKEKMFWWVVTLSDMWKETGWNSIIFLAAMSGIDQEQYEAATVDGAGRMRRMWHVTLPGIRPTIMIVFILSIGWLMSIGFEKQFLLSNPLVVDYSEVLELYILNYGIKLGRYSFGTAIGIFNSVVSIILLLTANYVFKKITKESVI
ncbi:ABC transporter permease [Paenibacillus sp. strain BS8-2]